MKKRRQNGDVIDGLRETSPAPAGVADINKPVRRDPIRWLIGAGLLLIVAIAIGTAVMIGSFRERALASSERELQNAALLLARHFDQQLADVEIPLDDLVAQLRQAGVASPDDFRRAMSAPEMHERMRATIRGSSDIAGVNAYDASGTLINSSVVSVIPAVNIADRHYFQALKSSSEVTRREVELVRSRFTGGWKTLIARRVTGPDGAFLGVVSRGIAPARFEDFFSSVALGSEATISILHRDGTLLARYPHDEAAMGRNFRSGPAAQTSFLDAGRGTARTISPVDGQERLVAIYSLNSFPLTVVATTTTSSALVDWRAQTKLMIGAATLSVLVIASILFLIVRQMNRQSRDTQQRLEAQKESLDIALNNMTQGLVLYDASNRIVICNQRYLDMFGSSAGLVKPGCSFHDVMRIRRAKGTLVEDVDAYCATILNDIAQGKLTSNILESGDGRSLRVVHQPLARGGWVATMEDITERRKLEEERDRNDAFLHQIIDHIPSHITVKNAHDRRYVLVNRVAEAEFGLPREQVLGRTPSDLFPKAAADAITTDDDKAIGSGADLFVDEEHLWDSPGRGSHYITSKRIGIRNQLGEFQYLINVVDDVSERRRAHDRIAHLAHYDALTGLPNRTLFRNQIERELARTAEGKAFALLYIDIDEFKHINDSLGHQVGDELLKAVAARLRSHIRETDLVARLGGDEFAVIQTNLGSADDAAEFVRRIHDAIRQPYDCLGHSLSTDASIGIALAPRDGTDLDKLVKNADLAMYGAKADGRRTHRFFEPAMETRAQLRLTMERDLRQALADGAFEVHYQPVVDLARDEVTGCEALLRWRHPDRGMVSPAEFVPVAEDTGLIVELGDWVLKTACAEAATWPGHVRLAVNVSPVQLKSDTLVLKIMSALASSGLAAKRLELEITEAVLIRDDETALAILHQLRAIGVRIALDDFGTGYSSLSRLKRFPFDKIKIDRCFVNDVAEADGSSAIVEAVVNIAVAGHMTTTAEGVETQRQKDRLRALGCTEMQGYLFSAAKPAAEVRRLFSGRGDAIAAGAA
ncbi:MAG: EAL domain-containing protein [Xanthobacteraceae bacterium]|nr:EAL domain-containing protein [Xanthobacteraceae bacterium]